jgi:hypothetical protein
MRAYLMRRLPARRRKRRQRTGDQKLACCALCEASLGQAQRRAEVSGCHLDPREGHWLQMTAGSGQIPAG